MEGALWFVFRGDELLVLEGETVRVPRRSPEDLGLRALFEHEVGGLDGRPCYAAEVEPDAGPPEGTVFRDLRGLWGGDEAFFRTAGRGQQVAGWKPAPPVCRRGRSQ